MVEKALVGSPDRRLVEAIKRVVDRLEATHGPLYGALLIGIEGRPMDEWVLLVGSAKLAARRLDGINAIVNAMKGLIPRDLSTHIRRVDVLRQGDPLYSHLSRAISVDLGGDASISSSDFFGFPIDRAVVFVLNRHGLPAARRTKTARRRKLPERAKTRS